METRYKIRDTIIKINKYYTSLPQQNYFYAEADLFYSHVF